jgi:SAM-dependent MidA family methyltransferase
VSLRAALEKVSGSATRDIPCVVIGNEFLDTVPVEQFERLDSGWQRRWVGVDADDRLTWTRPRAHPGLNTSHPLPNTELDGRFENAKTGDVVTSPDYRSIHFAFRGLSTFAALFIDYGHVSGESGDTLQAIRNHRFEHPLTSPGEADLSTQVDFREFARCLGAGGFALDGPVTQAEFLGRLGIVERASRLMSANPARAAEIEAGVARLMAPNGMGTRFKAIGVRSPHLPVLPGFG